MVRVIKNDRGEYAMFDMERDEWTWVQGRARGYEFSTRHFAWRIARYVGGKVYRVRPASTR